MSFSEHVPGTDGVFSPQDEAAFAAMLAHHAGKSVLITGAGGWIGSALSKAISSSGPRLLALLDHSEHDLHETYRDLTAASASHIVPVLGDICNQRQLSDLFIAYRPQIVYHLAAFKHVPLGESNPCAVIRNNAIGTYRLAMAAKRHRVAKLTMISTDKAASPMSVMGVSKRIAELALLALSDAKTQMNAVRFGNVYGSRGSIVPLFLQQISQGGPVTVTHPEAERYFISLRQAVSLALAACVESDAGIVISDQGDLMKVLDLAQHLIRRAGKIPGKDIMIKIAGLRPGDKISESFISSREAPASRAGHGLRYLTTPAISENDLHIAMDWLEECIQTHNLRDMLSELCSLVPEYEPSLSLKISAQLLWCAAEVI